MNSKAEKGISVVTRNLTYQVKDPKIGSIKTILDDVNFIGYPGQLIVIMGPSGCGKTTFLNALAGRLKPKKSNGTLIGDIFYNGRKDVRLMKEESNYVMQSDNLLEFLTVRETLFYESLLRLYGMPHVDRELRVAQIVNELGLTKCLDTYVGGNRKKGISGGQKKRVAIAIEMLDDPQLLFLDEPTSGLDSSLAYDTMKVLVDVAKTGRTVISTVHQPRSQTFALFDQLLLLTTGKVVYHGPANMTQNYFTSIGHPCPRQFNPADFFLDLISPENASTENHSENECSMYLNVVAGRVVVTQSQIESFPSQFNHSELGRSIMEAIKNEIYYYEEKFSGSDNRCYIPKFFHRREGPKFKHWFNSYLALTRRNFLNTYRNPIATIVRYIVQIMYGLIIGGVFFRLKRNGTTVDVTKIQVNNIISCLYLVVEQYAFSNMDSLFSFHNERILYNRDTANGLYTPSAFFFAKMTADLTFQHSALIIFSVLPYFMAGFGRSIKQFLFYILIGTICTFSSASYLYLIGTAIPNMQASSIAAPIGATVFLLLTGYFLKDEKIPDWFGWLKYINYLRFGFFAHLQNEFRFTEAIGSNSGLITSEHALMTIAQVPNSMQMWSNLFVCFFLGVGYRLVAFLFLKFLHRDVGLES